MSEKSVFDYKTYKPYLLATLGPSGQRTGRRAQAARAMNLQTSFLSQVLNGQAHLSLEQAHSFNEHIGHNDSESRHFLLLLQKERAGTKKLKDFFQKQILESQTKHRQISSRVKTNKALDEKAKAVYYSAWYYSAVHILLTLPTCQTKVEISQALQLPLNQVAEILEFLTNHGLAQIKDGKYTVGPVIIHLPQEDKQSLRHHLNWRSEALSNLSRPKKNDLHYTVVYSCSENTAEKIREGFLRVIQENLEKIAPSKEEVLYCNTIDFFDIKKG